MHALDLEINAEQAGGRLDKFLAEHQPEKSRALWQKLIKSGKVKVSGRVVAADYLLKTADHISAEKEGLAAKAENKKTVTEAPPIAILYENKDVLVVNKPAGVTVHAAASNSAPILTDFLAHHFPPIAKVGESEQKFGLVHRLDKDTSGVIVAAKNDRAFEFLKNEFKSRRVQKTYLALVFGAPNPPIGEIRTLLGRSKVNPTKQQVYLNPIAAPENAREAVTSYVTMESFGSDFALMQIQIYTGRMHQIRVHFKHLGHPVVGDKKYGFKNPKRHIPISRMFLHAASLGIELPDGQARLFTAPLPRELQVFLDKQRGKMRKL